MAMTLAEIRAKLQANEGRKGGQRSQGDSAIYPHWNIPEGTTARVRFLPDADPKNTLFWVTREVIRLPFAGIKGQSDSKPVVVQVPCMEMYKETCPILTEVRGWFKDKALEDMGRKYWKKRSYIFQGFVRENPLSDDKTPENPIRRFIISPQIFNLIKNALMDSHLVAGVGNIYANEALFRAGINPRLPACRIGLARYAVLTEKIREVLAEAIEAGGSSLRDYVNSEGEAGFFQDRFFVYGREGEGCLNCKTKIRGFVLGQRATFYCPRCQR